MVFPTFFRRLICVVVVVAAAAVSSAVVASGAFRSAGVVIVVVAAVAAAASVSIGIPGNPASTATAPSADGLMLGVPQSRCHLSRDGSHSLTHSLTCRRRRFSSWRARGAQLVDSSFEGWCRRSTVVLVLSKRHALMGKTNRLSEMLFHENERLAIESYTRGSDRNELSSRDQC